MTSEVLSLPIDLPADTDPGRPPVTQQFHVLKWGDTFLVADEAGDVHGTEDGLFHNDTRMISRLQVRLGGKVPWRLGSAVSHDNVFFTANLTNQPLPPLGGKSTPEGVIHLERKRLLWEDRLYERLRLTNFGESDLQMPLTLLYGGDFRDMFEVRGSDRPSRGTLQPPEVSDGGVVLRYTGLDGKERATWIAFSLPPDRLTTDRADFVLSLPRHSCRDLCLEIGLDKPPTPSRERFRRAAARTHWVVRGLRRRGARVVAPNQMFLDWTEKSQADLALLTTELPTGPYPYAGIPWFSTTFGRDAIITALQTLWLDPGLARGVLAFLAANQAKERSSFRDAAPGKIMHEARKGEMTALGELPFGQYYGGVDTTPLFVMLAGAYADRTGDLTFIEELWPSLEAAMGWVRGDGDSNGDGFLDYARGEQSGLANQGWKDSQDSIFHADGRFPEGPIALVEVQGYVYAAHRAMERLSIRRGDGVAAAQWGDRAARLQAAVEARFWMEEAGFYGVALDGAGALCRVRTSNPGHLLYTGLCTPERAAKVTEQLMSPAFNSGWGIRTVATTEARYNPMSYHNGSVWPHDVAICAAGIGRYGHRAETVRLMNKMFNAAVQFDMRLPELFCGFPHAAGEAPIPYPVACKPQAWAAGAAFMVLQSCLGLSIDGWTGQVRVDHPALPPGIEHLLIRDIPVGSQRVDLAFERAGHRVAVFARSPGQDGVMIQYRA